MAIWTVVIPVSGEIEVEVEAPEDERPETVLGLALKVADDTEVDWGVDADGSQGRLIEVYAPDGTYKRYAEDIYADALEDWYDD